VNALEPSPPPAPPRKLSIIRVVLALMVAVIADGLQFLLNVVGWFGADQIIDVFAMLFTSWLLGFHWLLLPTFVLEFVPLADELPTWTGCVIAVVYLRKRQERAVPPPPPSSGPIIDV